MIVAAKVVMVAIWIGAAASKLNKHFPYVTTMMGTAHWSVGRRCVSCSSPLTRQHTADHDSPIPCAQQRVIEMGVPLVLCFSDGGVVTLAAAAVMAISHLVILTSIPLGVPLEWNVFMIFGIGSLFVAHAELGWSDLQYPWPVVALMAVIVAAGALGNLNPPKVGRFCPACAITQATGTSRRGV